MAFRLALVLLKVCVPWRMPPAAMAKPSTSSRLPIMEPVMDALTSSSRPGLYRGDGDDEFGGVAQAGVEQGADARVGMRGQVFGRIADGGGQRDDADCGQEEYGHGSPAEQLGGQREGQGY